MSPALHIMSVQDSHRHGYHQNHNCWRPIDVYSYGSVANLELFMGRVPVGYVESSWRGVLVSWAGPQLTDTEKVVVQMSLDSQYSFKQVSQVAAILATCVQPPELYQPLMADVVQSLVQLVRNHHSTAVAST